MKRFLTGAVLALTLPAPIVPGVAWAVPAIVPVYGVKAERDGLTVRVPPLGSGRCTPTRRMMTMAVDKGAGGVTLLVAVNGNPECRASGGPDDIRWTYAELGLKAGDPFRFANPLVAEPGSMQPATGAALDKRLCQKLQVVAEAPQGEGAVRLLGPRGAIDIEAQPLVAPGEITSAEAGVDATGVTVVRFSIAQPAAARVLAWTSTHRGGRMATLLDGRVIQENEVGAPMGGNGLQVNAVDRARALSIAAGIVACSG